MNRFVRVRVTDMRGVDMSRHSFDFDLTLAVLTMDAEGRVYHRYGGRDERGAGTWLSEASFVRMLQATLATHASANLVPLPEPPSARRLEEVPSFAKRDKGECIHCHSVNTSLYEEASLAKTVTPDWIWKHPTPMRLGLDLDRDDQQLVTRVDAEGAAEEAGLREGDRIRSIAKTIVVTASDLMGALERASPGDLEMPFTYERSGEALSSEFLLQAGWKRGTPQQFAWRPTKWALTPAPGFGGPLLDTDALVALGLAEDAFALRVNYFVTWGDNQRYGRAAGKAGLRAGDILTAIDGVSDFESIDHFHSWWRLKRKFGETVHLSVLRAGESLVIELQVIP